MNVTYDTGRLQGADEADTGPSMLIRVLRLVLLPLSLVLWVIGISQTNTNNLGTYGLPAALPVVFYAGIVGLLISAGIEFSRPRISEVRLALHSMALVVILYGTAPLVYKEGRYAWLYKTIGVVQYVNAHGSLDRSIDIYQNWPGFFALAAWFDKVAGVDTALDYAKWAQLVFELAAIPLLYTIYKSLALPTWHRWVAIMLYSGANWIGQDYFSPQGMSTVLSLGIMALVVRWTLVVTQADQSLPKATRAERTRRSAPFLAAIIVLFFVLTASHELSPYIVTIQVAALAVTGLARPRWIALVLATITLAYLAPNFTFVNEHYGVLSSIGSFFSNLQPPTVSSDSGLVIPASHRFISDCTLLLTGGIWILAAVGAWLRRRARKMVLALVLLTYSPILVLAAGSYGNEGILRVYLFSLPWAVTLAASALAPLRNLSAHAGRNALRAIVPLAIAVALFFPSFFGDDSSNMMSASQVQTLLAFQESMKPGTLLLGLGNAAVSDTANYNEWPVTAIFGGGSVVPGTAPSDVATYLARTMVHFSGTAPAYVVITPSMIAYNDDFGLTEPSNFPKLLGSLAKSKYWSLVANDQGTVIYQMTAAASKVPAGSYAAISIIGVP